jgi:hypothetical protein
LLRNSDILNFAAWQDGRRTDSIVRLVRLHFSFRDPLFIQIIAQAKLKNSSALASYLESWAQLTPIEWIIMCPKCISIDTNNFQPNPISLEKATKKRKQNINQCLLGKHITRKDVSPL